MKIRNILNNLRTVTSCNPEDTEKINETIKELEDELMIAKKYQLKSLKKHLGEN